MVNAADVAERAVHDAKALSTEVCLLALLMRTNVPCDATQVSVTYFCWNLCGAGP